MLNYSNSARSEKTRSLATVSTCGRTNLSWTQTSQWSWNSNSSKFNMRSMICCPSFLSLGYRKISIFSTTKTQFFQLRGLRNSKTRRKLATLVVLLNFKKSLKWPFAHSAATSAARIAFAKREISPNQSWTNKEICNEVQSVICATVVICLDKCCLRRATAFRRSRLMKSE